MNLKLKIDKYGNLINLDTNTIVVPSNELFTDNFWETDGTTWKVNTTTQVTASTSDVMPTVVPIGEFTQGSRVDFYFRLHLPILDYNKNVNIFEFSTGTSNSYDISFYKLASNNNYYIYVNDTKQILSILSTKSLDIVGILSVCNIGSNTLAVFITLYSNEDGTLTKLVDNAYRSSVGSGNRLYFGVSRNYHTNLSSYMVEGMAFDEDIINPTSAITKYLNDTGLSEVWTNIKNYIASQLLGKQDTLVSGSNIKTVNNQSLLGSGNVSFTPPTFTYDSSTETLTVSNTTATVFNYDGNTETLEIQING